jgi:hypothetical protein
MRTRAEEEVVEENTRTHTGANTRRTHPQKPLRTIPPTPQRHGPTMPLNGSRHGQRQQRTGSAANGPNTTARLQQPASWSEHAVLPCRANAISVANPRPNLPWPPSPHPPCAAHAGRARPALRLAVLVAGCVGLLHQKTTPPRPKMRRGHPVRRAAASAALLGLQPVVPLRHGRSSQ